MHQFEHVTGMVFDIQRYSLHDGPGLRSDIFFSGCPLRCAWCSNPESQRLQAELLLFEQQCMRCGQFEKPCPLSWKHDRNNGWKSELEEHYSERAVLCPTEAIRRIGKRRTAGDVMQEVLRDAPFYENGGGITLTGGEPTMQSEMAEALLRLAKTEKISTAIETCGYAQRTVFKSLLPYLDHILYDLKHVDAERHRIYTGVDNKLILSNLRHLLDLQAPLTIRIPLIPGFNADAKHIRRIAEFIITLQGSYKGIDLLPYHTLGKSKYYALGREYPWEPYQRLSNPEIEQLANIFLEYGLAVNIGG